MLCDIVFQDDDAREHDYNESDEEMTLVEHAEDVRQIRYAQSEDASSSIVRVKPKYYWIGAFVDGKAEVRNTEDSKCYFINDKLEWI